MKIAISISPNRPSSRNVTAHGNRKIVSMSKMMKSIATT
jgi:hypothetical protein